MKKLTSPRKVFICSAMGAAVGLTVAEAILQRSILHAYTALAAFLGLIALWMTKTED